MLYAGIIYVSTRASLAFSGRVCEARLSGLGFSPRPFPKHWKVSWTRGHKIRHTFTIRREPLSLINLKKRNVESGEDELTSRLDHYKAKATRHIFLIRHSQYHVDGSLEKDRTLTPLGMTHWLVLKLVTGWTRDLGLLSAPPPPPTFQHGGDTARLSLCSLSSWFPCLASQVGGKVSIVVCRSILNSLLIDGIFPTCIILKKSWMVTMSPGFSSSRLFLQPEEFCGFWPLGISRVSGLHCGVGYCIQQKTHFQNKRKMIS